MAIRYRPLPFGSTNTNGRHDTKVIASEVPVSMGREARRAYEKMLKAEGSSCGTPAKKKKRTGRKAGKKGVKLT